MIKFCDDTIDWIDYFSTGAYLHGTGTEIYRVYHKGKLLYPSPDDLELNYHLRVERSFTHKVKHTSDPDENPKVYDEIETGVETVDIRAAAPIYVATAGQYLNEKQWDNQSDVYMDLKMYYQLLVSLSYIGRGLMDSPRYQYYDPDTNNHAFANNSSSKFVHAHEKDTAILTYNINTNLRNFTSNSIYCPAMLDYVDGTRSPDFGHYLFGNKDYANEDERFDGYDNIYELFTSDDVPGEQREQVFYTGLNDLKVPIEGTYLRCSGYYNGRRPFIPIAYTGNYMLYYRDWHGRLYTYDEEESNFLVVENNNPSFGSYSAWANSLK